MNAKEYLFSKYPLVSPEWFNDNELTKEMITIMEEYHLFKQKEEMPVIPEESKEMNVMRILQDFYRRGDYELEDAANDIFNVFSQSHKEVTLPSDEIINKKIFEICTKMRQWDGKSHPVTVPELMNEFVVWFKSKVK